MRLIQFITCCLAVAILSGCNNDKAKVNKAPNVDNSSYTTQADTELNGQLSASDPEGDTLTFMLDDEPANGTLVLYETGSFSYLPKLEFTGDDSFTFTVYDSNNMPVSASVNINIEALPVSFSDYSREVFNADSNAEPASVNGRVFANDVDTTEFYQDLVDVND
ncbi:hypothetical protein DS2_17397 [Catenovulum agarivorans DS-2]|uniref:Cadherin domain-containing protein n=1 Tax=Catenovulum agarivorans DS-2 TaxID=1328313 RepID=W7QSU0_9ALTE|nr:Ig-like domain-containing protein [Catenovulum agarivorans]EWH08465.1 hypothetical protein DS2_17397 [Catenovulum agarivorans DS-2]